MKKNFLIILAGVLLGILVIVGASALIKGLAKDTVSDEIAGSEDYTYFEDVTQDIDMNIDTEDVPMFDEDGNFIGEEETEGATEVVQPTESETSQEPEQNSESQNNTQKPTPNATNQNTVKKPEYPYYIRVNRKANCVTIYKKDKKGKYSIPVKAMTCSVGLTGETPLGKNRISNKYTWRLLFGNSYGQYSVRFNGHILFHSVPYEKQEKDKLKKNQYNMLGQPASQGCVRLACIDAKWIYDNCKTGTIVEVYESDNPGPLGKPEVVKVNPKSPYKGWDPTDPDKSNPWNKGKAKITGAKNITVKQGQKVNLLKGVKAKDVDGMPLDVEVTGKVNKDKPGKYKITYTATSATRAVVKKTITVTVKKVKSKKDESEKVSEKPENTEKPENSEKPESSETPESSEKPESSETPESSEVPSESETPESSEVPSESETPESSEVPSESEAPISSEVSEN